MAAQDRQATYGVLRAKSGLANAGPTTATAVSSQGAPAADGGTDDSRVTLEAIANDRGQDASAAYAIARRGGMSSDESEFQSIKANARFFQDGNALLVRSQLKRTGAAAVAPSGLISLDEQLYPITSLVQLRQEFDARVRLLEANPPGAENHLTALRELGITGYYLGWRLTEDDQLSAAKQVTEALTSAFAPHLAAPPPELVLPLVRYHLLLSQYAWSIDDDEARQAADGNARNLVDDIAAHPPDQLLLRRIKARMLWDTAAIDDQATKSEACDLFLSVALLSPTNETNHSGVISCRTDAANQLLRNDNPVGAVALLEVALEDFRDTARHLTGKSADFYLNEVRLLNSLTATEQDPPISQGRAAYKLSAARRFSEILDGGIYYQPRYWDARNLYVGFNNLTAADLADERDPQQSEHELGNLFSSIASSVEASRREFPRSPSFAFVALDSRNKAVSALSAQGRIEDALGASDEAMAVFRESPLIARFTDFDRDAGTECHFLQKRIELLLKAGRTGDAEDTFAAMDQGCGAWLRKFPWDYYSRASFTIASSAIGRRLFSDKRFEKALPALTYASNWGNADASYVLADMYRMGRGVAVDEDRSETLQSLAELQSLKRFFVPIVTADGAGSTLTIFVQHYGEGDRCPFQTAAIAQGTDCVGYDGIDDQALWASALGASISPEVLDSFRQLDRIARDNDVSFPELTMYALNMATEEAADTLAPDPVVPQGPPPLSDAQPIVLSTRFSAFQTAASGARVTWQTRVAPFVPEDVCYGWFIDVKPEFRAIRLREDYYLPERPAHMGFDPTHEVTSSPDGKLYTSRFTASLEGGMLSNLWCFSEGDPLGTYGFEVFAGDTSLYKVEFEVVPATDTGPPASAIVIDPAPDGPEPAAAEEGVE